MEQNQMPSEVRYRIRYQIGTKDVDYFCEQLRMACDLFKRSAEINITKDGNDVYVEGPDSEIDILESGFWPFEESDEEGEY